MCSAGPVLQNPAQLLGLARQLEGAIVLKPELVFSQLKQPQERRVLENRQLEHEPCRLLLPLVRNDGKLAFLDIVWNRFVAYVHRQRVYSSGKFLDQVFEATSPVRWCH